MEDSELIWSNLDRLDHSWPVDEETLAHQRNTASAKNKLKTTKTKSRSKINNENVAILEQSAEEGPSGLKKLDHNAKERIRRMKLNASFLALRALLPDSRRSKKKWSAPAIVDKVLKYIPEMENEIEALRCKMENMQSQAKSKKITADENSSAEFNMPTISLNRVNKEEAIIQVCMGREDESRFTNLLQSVEDEAICIRSASALDISETRICYHLHIQNNNSTTSEADHYFEELRDK
ncbi:hypothetical protein C2S53_017032, partial [Perilla frutescens var. hirtella]